jgi:hypothetical protein
MISIGAVEDGRVVKLCYGVRHRPSAFAVRRIAR